MIAPNQGENEGDRSPTFVDSRACDWRPDWRPAYLEALANVGKKGEAALLAGVTLRAVQKMRLRDRAFAAEEETALRVALDRVEALIMDHVLNGTTRTRFGPGGIQIQEQEFCTNLTLRLAERLERGTWVQRQINEITQPAANFPTVNDHQKALAEAEQKLLQNPTGLMGSLNNGEPKEAKVIEIGPISEQVTDNKG